MTDYILFGTIGILIGLAIAGIVVTIVVLRKRAYNRMMWAYRKSLDNARLPWQTTIGGGRS